MSAREPQLKLFLPWTPATREQTCICCHLVRHCRGCCNKCPAPCSCKHDCEFTYNDLKDCEWWNSLAEIFNWEIAREALPKNLLDYANKNLIE